MPNEAYFEGLNLRIENLEANKTETAYYLEKVERRLHKLEQVLKDLLPILKVVLFSEPKYGETYYQTYIQPFNKLIKRLSSGAKEEVKRRADLGCDIGINDKCPGYLIDGCEGCSNDERLKEAPNKYWGGCQQAIDLAVRKERDKWDEEKEEPKQNKVNLPLILKSFGDTLEQDLKKEFVEEILEDLMYLYYESDSIYKKEAKLMFMEVRYKWKAKYSKAAQEK